MVWFLGTTYLGACVCHDDIGDVRATGSGWLTRTSEEARRFQLGRGGLLEAQRRQGKGDSLGSSSARLGDQQSGTNVT